MATVEFSRVRDLTGSYLALRGVRGKISTSLELTLREYHAVSGDIGSSPARRLAALAKLRREIRKLGHGTAITRTLHRMREPT